MSYPTDLTQRSYGGSVPAAYITTSIPNYYAPNQAITISSAAGWYEVSPTGQATTNPLGTSGPFVVSVNLGQANEEKILCSSVNIANSIIVVWTDGTNNGRGYDGTIIQTHTHQTTQTKTNDIFHVATAVESLQFNQGVIYAVNTSNQALSYAQTIQGVQGVQGYRGVQGAQGYQGTIISLPLSVPNGGMGSYVPTPGAVVFGGATANTYTDTSSNGGGATGAAGSLFMSYGNIANGGPEWVQFQVHQSVQVVSTTNVAGTYTVGGNTTNDYPINADTFTVTATGSFVVDGYTVQLNDRILLAGQTTQTQNGIWLCTTQGTTGVSAVFCRDNDADTPAKIAASIVQVNAGTTYGGTSWQVTSPSTATFGSSSIPVYQIFTAKSTIPIVNGGTGTTIGVTTNQQTLALGGTNNVAETIPRWLSTSVQPYTVPRFTAVYLVAGQVINSIKFSTSGTAGSSLTSEWIGIFSSAGLCLAISSQSLTSLAANTTFTWNLSSAYTVPSSGLYYVGLGIYGTTSPVYPTISGYATGEQVNLTGTAPILNYTSGSATPVPTVGTTTFTPASNAGLMFYASLQ